MHTRYALPTDRLHGTVESDVFGMQGRQAFCHTFQELARGYFFGLITAQQFSLFADKLLISLFKEKHVPIDVEFFDVLTAASRLENMNAVEQKKMIHQLKRCLKNTDSKFSNEWAETMQKPYEISRGKAIKTYAIKRH